MLTNKRAYELLYLQLKGQDHIHYSKIRNQYENEYNQLNRSTSFAKHWSKALSTLRHRYNYTIPKRNENQIQRDKRMQTPTATRTEIDIAMTRLRNYKQG